MIMTTLSSRDLCQFHVLTLKADSNVLNVSPYSIHRHWHYMQSWSQLQCNKQPLQQNPTTNNQCLCLSLLQLTSTHCLIIVWSAMGKFLVSWNVQPLFYYISRWWVLGTLLCSDPSYWRGNLRWLSDTFKNVLWVWLSHCTSEIPRLPIIKL